MEAIEFAVRNAVLGQGASILGQFMTSVGMRRPRSRVMCHTCTKRMRSTGNKTKHILTMLGEVPYTRSRYTCTACGAVRYPADESFGIENTSRSPGVRRQVARLGAKETFHETAEDMQELAGIELSRKDAERISEDVGEKIAAWDNMERKRARVRAESLPDVLKTIETFYIEFDGTGAPMVPWELEGRKGKQPDGSAKTREIKLGCVFTQTALDEKGRPIRDPNSTTFTGAIEGSATFGWRIYEEALRRGFFQAKCVVVLGDGAEWIKNLAQHHFPNALRIIDFYHAKEHVANLCRALFSQPMLVVQYRERWWQWLEQGNIEAIMEEARNNLTRDPQENKDARREIDYLDKNKQEMRYEQFRHQGLFIGSGVIEAACKNIVGRRLKQSGMEWTVRGANAITALRCAQLSGRMQDYWDHNAA